MTIICRPGEHLVQGRPAIHNLDTLTDHLNLERLRSAPDDVESLSDDDLARLRIACLTVFFMSQHNPMKTPDVIALRERYVRRLEAERVRRGWVA